MADLSTTYMGVKLKNPLILGACNLVTKPEIIKQIEDAGLKGVGTNPESGLVEVVELKDHPWFIGVQYHPELKSTVMNPHPLFVKFVEAAINYKKTVTK